MQKVMQSNAKQNLFHTPHLASEDAGGYGDCRGLLGATGGGWGVGRGVPRVAVGHLGGLQEHYWTLHSFLG
jgi:hypothetical protein